MNKIITPSPLHPAKSLLPALEVMAARGFSSDACLEHTRLTRAQLEREGVTISASQELQFYTNVLELSGDESIGLELGDVFVPERYGLFGYALLAAETFEHALALAENFGPMTFSFFGFRYGQSDRDAWFELTNGPEVSPGLSRLFIDRAVAAAARTFSAILGDRFRLHHVLLPHEGKNGSENYFDLFQCPVSFQSQHARLVFDASLLDQPLLQSNRESSLHLEQQCQLIMARLGGQGRLVNSVRLQVLSRPGVFPEIDVVAEALGMSARTLRRRLMSENTSYREIVDELRYGLALEYLGSTALPMDEISRLLGYTGSANFSHAFRRWAGLSPSAWRRR
ncbi:AraC family transcriptional regulator [Halioglobus maricola]|uniref:AraC family transcriptional regulator n=1 Tax=Halioglobus maricola TaxID=2601894 RepID=A0A5P9NL40_9GAMM|nr:AraC family transcriptional regulator [Halioglobus maricola]QFU75658.1 AraC family transcriptional regulator [Halioglobus maricola]